MGLSTPPRNRLAGSGLNKIFVIFNDDTKKVSLSLNKNKLKNKQHTYLQLYG